MLNQQTEGLRQEVPGTLPVEAAVTAYKTTVLRSFSRDLLTEASLDLPTDWSLLFYAADPHVTYDARHGLYHVTCQADVRLDNSLNSIVVRSAPSLEEIAQEPDPDCNQTTELCLRFSDTCEVDENGRPYNKQVWAPELHCEKDGSYTLRVSMSNGENATHRVYVYEAPTLQDTFTLKGKVAIPTELWAIDGTVIDDLNLYMWSGWERPYEGQDQQQHIFAARMKSPTEIIGEPVRLFSPEHEWQNSVMGILEGPQSARYKGKTWGLTVAANASWTQKYNTALFYRDENEDPATPEAWVMDPERMFSGDYGAGHGRFIENMRSPDELYFLGHCKTLTTDGWPDRVAFLTKYKVSEVFERREKVLQSRNKDGIPASDCR